MQQYTVLIATAVILLIGAVVGYIRGFLKLALSVLAVVLSLVIVSLLKPVVTDFLVNRTGAYEQTKSAISSVLLHRIEDSEKEDGETLTEEEQAELLTVPESWKKGLAEKYEQEKAAGMSSFVDYAAGQVARTALEAVSFALTVLILIIGFHILMTLFDVIGKIPVLGTANRTAGALVGLAAAVVVLWLVRTLVAGYAASGSGWAVACMDQIEASGILRFFYNGGLLGELEKLVFFR